MKWSILFHGRLIHVKTCVDYKRFDGHTIKMDKVVCISVIVDSENAIFFYTKKMNHHQQTWNKGDKISGAYFI